MCHLPHSNMDLDSVPRLLPKATQDRAVAHGPAGQAMAGPFFVIEASAKMAIITIYTAPIPIVV